MTYAVEVLPSFKKDYKKLCGKNNALKKIVDEKIMQIAVVAEENPGHYKPLKHPLEGLRRVHVADAFVLVFKILEKEKIVRLEYLEHHDAAYKRR